MSQGYKAVSFKSTYGFPKHCPDFMPNNSTNQNQDQLQTDYYSCLNENAQKFKMDLEAYLDSAQRFCCFVQEALKCETKTLAKCDKKFAALNTVTTENLLNYSCPGMWPADCSELDSSSNLGMYLGIGIGSVLTFIFFGLIACYYKKWLCFGETIVDKLEIDKLEIDKLEIEPILGSGLKIPKGSSWPPTGLKEKLQLQWQKASEISANKNSLREQIEALEKKRMELDKDPEAAMADMEENSHKWSTAIEALEKRDVKEVRKVLSRIIEKAQELEVGYAKQLDAMLPSLQPEEYVVEDITQKY